MGVFLHEASWISLLRFSLEAFEDRMHDARAIFGARSCRLCTFDCIAKQFLFWCQALLLERNPDELPIQRSGSISHGKPTVFSGFSSCLFLREFGRVAALTVFIRACPQMCKVQSPKSQEGGGQWLGSLEWAGGSGHWGSRSLSSGRLVSMLEWLAESSNKRLAAKVRLAAAERRADQRAT